MGNKLYVGGLSYSTTEDSLADLFADAGDIASVKIIIDRDSGRSKGFGFVEMASSDAANSAIERFNGANFEGREITVNEARPQAPRSNQNSYSRGGSRW
ncbi:MAG: RNA recognition motif domain-containing protein [Oligoflexus sp.]